MTNIHLFSFSIGESDEIRKCRICCTSSSEAFSCFWKLQTRNNDKSDITIHDHVQYFTFTPDDCEF